MIYWFITFTLSLLEFSAIPVNETRCGLNPETSCCTAIFCTRLRCIQFDCPINISGIIDDGKSPILHCTVHSCDLGSIWNVRRTFEISSISLMFGQFGACFIDVPVNRFFRHSFWDASMLEFAESHRRSLSILRDEFLVVGYRILDDFSNVHSARWIFEKFDEIYRILQTLPRVVYSSSGGKIDNRKQ